MLNKYLQQQIDTYIGKKKIPAQYQELFKALSKSYNRCKKESRMLEKLVDLGSGELMKLNNKLKTESALLREAEEEIKTIFENTDVVFFSIDMINYKVNQMSVACEKVYGYKPEEFSKNINLWKEVIHPDDLYLLDKHEENLAKGRKLYYLYRIIHKDKSIRWVESKVIPTLNSEGKLVRVDGIVTDNTGEKESDIKLLQEEHFLTEAQQLGKMGNWNIDLIRKTTFWSEGLRTIYGVGKEFIPTFSKFMALVHPDDKDNVANELSRAAETGRADDVTYRIIRANDGKERVIHSILRTERNAAGRIIRIYGLSQDITLRKTNESKIEQLNLVMYQISHDLRGPLNSAKNYIYLALRRVDNKTANEYLVKINDSYNKMEHRVMSLLDIQRMNRNNIITEKINLCNLIRDIILSIDGLKGFGEVSVLTNIHITRELYSDRQFLHSILHNLISNAILHRRNIPDAFVKISAKTQKGFLVFKIEDNGEGIPEAMRSKIFDKFVKGANSTSGIGLGLYIVSDLVKRLNGEISFETAEMKGTTFTVKLPYRTKPEEAISSGGQMLITS